MVGNALKRICMGLRVLLALLMGSLAIPVLMAVVARYTPLMPTYLWTAELASFIFIWMAMIGSMVAVWDGPHFDVGVLPDARGPFMILMQNGFVLALVLGFGLIFA